MARPRPKSLNKNNASSNALLWATPGQCTVLVLTLTLVCGLLVVSGRWQYAGNYDLPRTPGFARTDDQAGHEVQFLESQQNLKHSNLMEVSIEDSNKIFKGRPSPETGSNSVDLTKNGNGFLSNVQEAKKGAVETYETAAASRGTKPLGFYFSKDIPHHVKEKALGIRSKIPSEIPAGGKAALGLYFNQDSKQSKELDSSDTHAAGQIGSRYTASQYRSTSEEQLRGSTADATADMHGEQSRVKDTKHRKELQGISMNAQPRRETRLAQGQAQSLPANRKGDFDGEEDFLVQEADDTLHSSLVIAVNSSAGQFKPIKKRTSLNTDDM